MPRKYTKWASKQPVVNIDEDRLPQAEDKHAKIVVVGAGISGIVTARYITDRAPKADVVVLEANPERYGGRTWSFEVPGYPGKPVDFGAMWIHEYTDERNPIASFVRQKNIPTKWHDYGPTNVQTFIGSNEDVFAGKDSEKEMLVAWDMLDELSAVNKMWRKNPQSKDMPILDALKQGDHELYQDYLDMKPLDKHFLHYFIEDEEGNSSDLISGRMYGSVLEDEDDDQELDPRAKDHVVLGGYKELLKTTDKEVHVRLGQKVTNIEIVEDYVVVKTENGEEYPANYVVVTVPLGVLKANAIHFHPPLPNKQQIAIRRMGFGNFVKVLVVFDKVFWPHDKDWIYFFPGEDHPNLPRVYFVNIHAIHGTDGPPALVGVLVGKYAYQADHMSVEQATAWVLQVLQLIYPHEYQSIRPKVTFSTKTNWRTDPLFYGAYSHGGLGMEPEDANNVRLPIESKVFFAGEHTVYPEGVSASVTGAFSSGVHAAKDVLKQLEAHGMHLKKFD